MKHLINTQNLTTEEINQIYNRASEFEKGIRKANHINAHIVNMFFENSTRTKMSFEMAENKINANKYDFLADTSSIQKGEDLFDTINNLSAIGMNVVVMRHENNDLIENLSKKQYFQEISFINAGSGTLYHPTQALLDFYTMKKHFIFLSLVLALLAACAPKPADSGHSFIRVNADGQFVRDGKPYYFVGTNFWYGAILGSQGEGVDRERLHKELDFLKSIGTYEIRGNLPCYHDNRGTVEHGIGDTGKSIGRARTSGDKAHACLS